MSAERSAERQLFGVLYRAAPGLAVSWWALIVLRGLLPPAFALAMGVLVSRVQSGGALTIPLVAAGGLFLAMHTAGPLHDALSSNLGDRTTGWLHDRLLDACVSPPGLAHFENAELADQLAAARDFDAGITGPSITICMPNVGGGFAALAGGLAQALLLAGFRWWAPIVVGGAWISTHWLLAKGAVWRGRTSPETIEQQRRAEYAYRLAVDAPAAKEMRLFGLGPWVVDGFVALRRRLLDASWEERRLAVAPTRNAILLLVAANALFFGTLAHDAIAGRIGLGWLVVYGQAAIGAGALAFGELDWWFRTAAQPVPLVLGLAERMRPVGALANGPTPSTGMPAREIRFEQVRFAYPGTARSVLDRFDLTIPAGRSLAIVGQNGAGKTTLAKLVCRFYAPDAGTIRVDGGDLRELDFASWRARIAAVFQDFVRYELSLRDNVAPGGAPEADVLAALELARAARVAGVDTVLSRAYEGGTDLSGGQWQRVALARALAAVRLGAGVVILDEPTAQLDVRGEAEIFERLLDATRGCTTILVSHRFSTVRRADAICVIEHGRVVEMGSHDELIGLGGRYRTMFDLQAQRFDETEDVALDRLEAVE